MTGMRIRLKPGKYVVAVSGGVDSMVLLHLLAQRPERYEIIVAHFDHGIRPDSREDRRLVQRVARSHHLACICGLGRLGPQTSEARARDARYAFLRKVQEEQGAAAIVTAHHQDDMLETAVLNLLRGTGRRGLTSLGNAKGLRRPLLNYTKKDIRTYAKEHDLLWREDSTNADDRYLRNYIRHNILTRFGAEAKAALLERIERARTINTQIDKLLEQDLARQSSPTALDRAWYLRLPYAVAREVMATWLRRNGVLHFDRNLIEQLVVAAKTKRPGKLADINASYIIEFTKESIQLLRRTKNGGD